jgi:hypothetical protein
MWYVPGSSGQAHLESAAAGLGGDPNELEAEAPVLSPEDWDVLQRQAAQLHAGDPGPSLTESLDAVVDWIKEGLSWLF